MEQQDIYNAYLSELSENLNVLEDKPEETPSSTLKALWYLTHDNPKSAQLAGSSEVRDLPKLDLVQIEMLKELTARRLKGEPLAHITQRQQFMGVELLTGPEALVPRKETELLGNAVVELLNKMAKIKQDLRVIDVCTGAANLAIAYAKHVPTTKVYAADLSAEAVELAKKNVEYCGLGSRIKVRQGDLLVPFDEEKFHGQIDVLSCNPPYISSAKVEGMDDEVSSYEPGLAFDGGAFGIKIVQKLIQEAPKYVCNGGWLAFEIGLGQGPALTKRIQKNKNFSQVDWETDANGGIRVVLAKI